MRWSRSALDGVLADEKEVLVLAICYTLEHSDASDWVVLVLLARREMIILRVAVRSIESAVMPLDTTNQQDLRLSLLNIAIDFCDAVL